MQQANFFGTGNTVGFQVASGTVNKVASFSFTQPYYTVDGVSRGFDAVPARRELRLAGSRELQDEHRGQRRCASACRSPRYDTLFFGLGVEYVSLLLDGQLPRSAISPSKTSSAATIRR